MRKEKDALGERDLPADAYYGIQTARAMENFAVTAKTFNDYPEIVRAMIEVKKACAMANRDIRAMDAAVADAIVAACDEVLAGQHQGQFPVNCFRGCGTSINMNCNEVLANRANELLTGRKGYDAAHPNTHVNMGQSSNDVFPTAASLAQYRAAQKTLASVRALEESLEQKSRQWADVVRLGRTCYQDAVPLTVGQAFSGYHALARRNGTALEDILREGPHGLLGATAVGTGIGMHAGFLEAVYPLLRRVTGLAVTPCRNLFDGMQNADGYTTLSGAARSMASALAKMASDLRFLSSGPAAGIAEFSFADADGEFGHGLPPSLRTLAFIPQVLFRVFANDAAIAMAASSGEPDISPSGGIKLIPLLESLDLVTKACVRFRADCLENLAPDAERCRRHAEESVSLATVVAAIFGYDTGSHIARLAMREGVTCKQAALREGLFTQDEAEELFDPLALTIPSRMQDLVATYSNKQRTDGPR